MYNFLMVNSIKSLFVITLLFLTVTHETILNAQNSASIKGVVIDKQSERPIPDANIELLGTNIGDVADSSGSYDLQDLSPGTYTIRASRIGFKPQVVDSIVLSKAETRVVNFSLTPMPVKLRSVKIEAERLWEKYLTEASLVNVQRMSSGDILSIPGALDDPTRAVQIFSGVSGGGDYSGYLAVRGGSPDQNQVIMDGVVIPNPYRFRLAAGGGLSTINPNTTQNIYLHLGGFSAEYGNALSSILEVESRSGNRDHIRAQGSVNVTDMNAVVEGPFPGGIGSYIFSVRRTYYDLIANQISKSNSAFPFYFEISSKWAFDLNKNNRVILNFIRNQEGTELLDEFSEGLNLIEKVKSHLASITWRNLQGESWRFDTMFSYYHDTMSYRAFPPDTFYYEYNYEALNAKVVNFSFREDIRYKLSEKSWLNWGFSATTIPSNVNFDSADSEFFYARIESPKDIKFDRTYQYYATYFESSAKATEKLHLRIGLRYDYSTLIHEGEMSPRISIWYKLNDRTTLEGSWGLFYQYPNPLTIYTRNVPVDLSANLDLISAEKATHQIIAFERTFGKDLSAKLQVYNKDIDRLLLPIDEKSFLPINNGRGISNGIEFILEKKRSKSCRFSGIISYSYGKAKFRSLDSNAWLPFKYDRRHALTVLYNMRLVGNWNISLLGQYSSGLPFTEVLGLRNNLDFDGQTKWVFVRGSRFAVRFPAYKKIDARLSYQRRVGDKAFSFYLDIINVTNQKNIYEITWEKRILPDNKQQATKRTIYMLPLLPSFGVSFKL
jgi:hypothetical protein